MRQKNKNLQALFFIFLSHIFLSGLVPLSKAHTVMEKWGYTGSACIPMALDDAVRQGRLQPGENIILCGSGGGVALGCLAFRWTN